MNKKKNILNWSLDSEKLSKLYKISINGKLMEYEFILIFIINFL